MTSAADTTPGLQLDRLQEYLSIQLPDLAGPLFATLISGGRSNLTYRISDGTNHWVLRRPPLGGLTPSAHDVGREYRVVEALQTSGVPVARAVLFCDDPEVIGAPFAMVENVDGVVLRSQNDLRDLTDEQVRRLGLSLVDTMATLHRVDIAAVGLSDFGRPEGYLRRQVERWTGQWTRVKIDEVPDVARLGRLLVDTCPPESGHAIVHGDLRVDNTILDPESPSTVRALVDWEMATLGDPLADLALHLVYRDPAFAPVLGGDAASSDPRMPDFVALARRYADAAERPLDRLYFYLGLAYFKSAVIAAGIHARYLGGHTVGDGFELVGDAVPALVAAGLRAANEDR